MIERGILTCDECGAKLQYSYEPAYDEYGFLNPYESYFEVEDHPCSEIQEKTFKFNEMLEEEKDLKKVLMSFRHNNVWNDKDGYEYQNEKVEKLVEKSYKFISDALQIIYDDIEELEEFLSEWE